MKLFVCVGTGLEPFDRLIKATDSAIDAVTAAHADSSADSSAAVAIEPYALAASRMMPARG